MTRDEFMEKVNAGADLVTLGYEGSYADEYANAANIIVCAIGTVFDNPEATLEDVFRENFDAESWGQWSDEFPAVLERLGVES